jgi:hypothetical protein
VSILEEDPADERAAPDGWQPRPWWAWAGTLIVGGTLLVAWAGTLLAAGDLGTTLRPRGCDGQVVGAIALLGAGALAVLAGMALTRLQEPGALLAWDAETLPWTLPAPLLLLGGTLPGVAGCTLARDLAALPVVGSALVGASGIVLAGAAVTLLAAALATTASVTAPQPDTGADEPPGIVDLAIAQAEALESEPASQRFRGVDPID